MKKELTDGDYNCKLIISDWRYSASVVGLIKYFDFLDLEEGEDYLIEEDALYYNDQMLEKEKYLDFAEEHFKKYMHHKNLITLIEEYEEQVQQQDQEKLKKLTEEINSKFNANSIMKKVFKGKKIDNTSKKEIEGLLYKNKYDIIEQTYINGKKLYDKYCNKSSFFTNHNVISRLKGYYQDKGRKMKSLGYFFDKNTFKGEDFIEFDFIPFAFTKTREAFFINNNFNIKRLMDTYRKLNDKILLDDRDVNKYLFDKVNNASTFINYDVEAIKISEDTGYYETVYIRSKAIDIFKNIGKYQVFIEKIIKINDKYYLNIEKEVVNCILNLNNIDYLIETLLKKSSNYILTSGLIVINNLIYNGGEKMNEEIELAKKEAYYINVSLLKSGAKNKIDSFKNKLLSSIIAKDYDSFNVTLLKLSTYSNVKITFAYDLFDDFESNKNIAYTFVNALGTYYEGKKDEGEQNNEK